MAYNYTINGETVAAKGVKLTGDGETRTLVDTRSIHADIIGGNVKIRIDPDTPADMSDDTEIGTSRAITAAEMSGAVTLGYNPSTQKVHGYVNGGDAVSRTLEQLGIATGGAEKLVPSSGTYFNATELTSSTEKLVFPNKGAGIYVGILIGTPLGNNSERYFCCAIRSKNGSLVGASIGFSESSTNPNPAHSSTAVVISADNIEITSISGGRFGYNHNFDNYEIYFVSEGSITG